MSVLRGLFVRKDSTRGTGPSEARVALAGLLLPDGDLGIVPGVLSGLTVAGIASTWAYAVSPGHVATTRGATDGVVLFAVDGVTNTSPPVPAAPASGSRWDLIWIRHMDVDNSDPSSGAVLGVTSGTASGSPSKPYGDVPVGAEVLAEAQVAAGATGTLHANVVITPVARRTGLRGGIIRVTNQAQLDALASFASAANPIRAELGDIVYRNTGSGWLITEGPLPYLLLTASVALSRPGNAWSSVASIQQVAETAGDQPWTVSTDVVTVTRDGLYRVEAHVTSVGGLSFAVSVFRSPVGDVLAQTTVSGPPSLSQGCSSVRRLTAGQAVYARVYPVGSTAMTVAAHGPNGPTCLSITRLSD